MSASISNTALPWTRFLPSVDAIVLIIAVTLFVGICVVPTLYVFVDSFVGADGGFSLGNYSGLLTDSRQLKLLSTSAFLGGGTALLAAVIGIPLGLLLARADLPARRLLRLALVVPLVMPPYMLALAWVYVGGSAGVVAYILGRDVLSGWTYSLTGAILVLGLNLYPLLMLATEAAARRTDGRLEEAALFVARRRRVLWSITLPLIAPSITAAILIVFVLALSEFSVPSILRVRVFTTEVFTAFAALYNFGTAAARATPLLSLTLAAAISVKLIVGDRWLTTRRNPYAGLSLTLGRWRAFALAGISMVLAASVILPLGVLALQAGGLKTIIVAFGFARQAIVNSLVLATVGATLILILAAVLGYGRARARTRLKELVDLALVVCFAVPSTVVGIGLIGLWNRPGWPGKIYSSSVIIIVAYLARFLPVATLILAASAGQISPSVEESAQLSGASWPRIFSRIVLPQMTTGLAAAWVVSFIFAFEELGATLLVAPPGESTMPGLVYTLIANTRASEVAALALMQVLVILVPLVFLGMFASNRGR